MDGRAWAWPAPAWLIGSALVGAGSSGRAGRRIGCFPPQRSPSFLFPRVLSMSFVDVPNAAEGWRSGFASTAPFLLDATRGEPADQPALGKQADQIDGRDSGERPTAIRPKLTSRSSWPELEVSCACERLRLPRTKTGGYIFPGPFPRLIDHRPCKRAAQPRHAAALRARPPSCEIIRLGRSSRAPRAARPVPPADRTAARPS